MSQNYAAEFRQLGTRIYLKWRTENGARTPLQNTKYSLYLTYGKRQYFCTFQQYH